MGCLMVGKWRAARPPAHTLALAGWGSCAPQRAGLLELSRTTPNPPCLQIRLLRSMLEWGRELGASIAAEHGGAGGCLSGGSSVRRGPCLGAGSSVQPLTRAAPAAPAARTWLLKQPTPHPACHPRAGEVPSSDASAIAEWTEAQLALRQTGAEVWRACWAGAACRPAVWAQARA